MLSWDRAVLAEGIASAKALRQEGLGTWEEPQGWSGVSDGESGEEWGTKWRITDLQRLVGLSKEGVSHRVLGRGKGRITMAPMRRWDEYGKLRNREAS